MRTLLSRAAYEVIAQRGHSSFRTAAVAEHAGVSQGALSHHFPTKDAVTLAAVEFALARASERSKARLAKTPDDREAILEAMFDDFADFFNGDGFWVTLDITMDALKSSPIADEIRDSVGRERAGVYADWEDRLTGTGLSGPAAILAVRAAAAVVSGSAIRRLWTTEDETAQELKRLWRILVSDLGKT